MSLPLSTDLLRAIRGALLGVSVLLTLAGSARADEPFEVPRPPREHAPIIAGEARIDVVFPVLRRPLCPRGSECVFGGGAGLGGVLEWRWPTGLGVGLGYDGWFLDGNGVHELTTMQSLRATLRYHFLLDRQAHPWIGGALGGLLFGDTFAADAGGVLLDLQAGVELELTASLAFTVGVLGRFFTTTSFRTSSDGVERAERVGLDGALVLTAGLVLLPGI